MRRCSRCLLPETYPSIRYNEESVCNYCLSYTPIEYKGETKLEELLDTSRNRNIVVVSGSRDSTSKKFFPAMVPALCLGCRYGIAGGACKVAMRYKVPLVFFSSSRLEKTSFKNEFFKTCKTRP